MMGEVIRVSGRAPDVGKFLREAMLSQKFADVALCCPGGQRFLAHRLVLSAASPYLQEVLLAHSKTTGLCEPITVILAEVEGPELAAILGLVYTGSAAVPRPRLDAFLRAAEALHIRLPPLPEMMTSHSEDCKPEGIEDVKINSKYLQCEQYPSYDRWFGTHEAIFNKYEDYDRTDHHDSSRGLETHPQDLKTDRSPVKSFAMRYGRSMRSEIRPSTCFSLSPNAKYDPGTAHGIDRNLRTDRDPRETGTKRDRMEIIACHEPSSEVNSIPIPNDDRDTEIQNRLRMPRFDHDQTRFDRNPDKDSVNLTTVRRRQFAPIEERALTRQTLLDDGGQLLSMTNNVSPSNRIDDNRFPAPDPGPGMHVERSYEESSKIPESLFDLRVTSLHPAASGRTVAADKMSYGQNGQDLSCRENCCGWRPPKRHVANHVTASPWRQLTRPHHSPKIRPIVLQNDAHLCEPGGKLQRLLTTEISRTEAMQPLSSPANDQFSRSTASSGSFHGFEVPASTEIPLPNEIELLRIKERRLQEFYRAQMLFPSPQPVGQQPVNFGPTHNFFMNQQNFDPPVQPGTQIRHSNGAPQQTDGQANLQNIPTSPNFVQIGQGCPRPCAKPELSHPVSRLCESTKHDEVSVNFSSSLSTKFDEDGQTLEEKVGRGTMQSDPNNNNACMSDGVQNRSEGIAADDHRCEQCGKSFVTRASLKVHARTHSGEKPFQCSDCGKQFSQLRNYKYHRSVHEGTREFAATCPECGKYFNDRGYLSSHMKIHRNRKEYACGECGKSFNQRVAYNMHVRIHTGVKPHQCEQCGKAFSRKMLLKQHLRTHSGERPYQCQVCHKAFADRSNMTLHTRLHSGLKPYQCTLCSKAFTKKHHLKTHLNYHTGTKPYSCPNCGLRFSQSSNMRTHYKKCSVNNPNGMQVNANGRNDSQNSRDSDGSKNPSVVHRGTPSAALTPPNSDQESSILTPIPRSQSLDAAKT